MRRLSLWVWDVDECRYDSVIGQTRSRSHGWARYLRQAPVRTGGGFVRITQWVYSPGRHGIDRDSRKGPGEGGQTE